ncbi:S1 family peptidase [Humitalea rosea]|nr:serine protease [Humitalea rosea]
MWLTRGLMIALLAAATGCAPGLQSQAAGTPAAALLQGGFATVLSAGPGSGPHGSAIAMDREYVLTSAHLLRAGERSLWLRRPDGMMAHAQVVALGAGLDLLVLRTEVDFLSAPKFAHRAPLAGEAVWALGAPGIGPSLSVGRVDWAQVVLEGSGPGFVAQMPALMGYSGGPVVNADGAVLGLTTAMLRTGTAVTLGHATGIDLDGLTQGQTRRVFALSAESALAEARRLTAAAAQAIERHVSAGAALRDPRAPG